METQVRPSDFKEFEGYYNELAKNVFALNLLTFGYSNFYKAKKIQQLDKINEFVSSGEHKQIEKMIEFAKENDFFFYALLDSIIISISFENYFKAKLLINGFIIHLVDKDKNLPLYKKQKKEPVLVNELIRTKDNDFPELKDLTLNYSLILDSSDYNKYYNIDIDVIKYLKLINSYRNKLHLYMSEFIPVNEYEVKNLCKLREIVNLDIAILQNFLLDKTGAKSNSRIKINNSSCA